VKFAQAELEGSSFRNTWAGMATDSETAHRRDARIILAIHICNIDGILAFLNGIDNGDEKPVP
jgi:hypothetical protein